MQSIGRIRQRIRPAVSVGMGMWKVGEEDDEAVAVAPDGGWVEQHVSFLLFDAEIPQNLAEQIRANVRTVPWKNGHAAAEIHFVVALGF
jgi:hypothetical protein